MSFLHSGKETLRPQQDCGFGGCWEGCIDLVVWYCVLSSIYKHIYWYGRGNSMKLEARSASVGVQDRGIREARKGIHETGNHVYERTI